MIGHPNLQMFLDFQAGVTDLSGPGNTVSKVGSGVYGPNGLFGSCYVGSTSANSYISVIGNKFLNAQALTACCWVNRTGSVLKIFGLWNGYATGSKFILRQNASSNALQAYAWAAAQIGGDSGQIIPAMGWHHYALVYDKVSLKTYVDGVLQTTTYASTADLNTPTITQALIIGAEYDLSAPCDAMYDSPMIFNVALPACDILRVMHGRKPLTASIIADQYSANVVFLLQGSADLKGHSLALNGTASFTATQKKFSGVSLATGGLAGWLTVPSSAEWALPGDFTIEAWIYPNAWNNNSVIVLGNTSGGIQLGQYSTQNLGVCQNGIAWVIPGGTIQPPVGQWSYIAWSRTGSANRLYVNGNLAGTATDTKSYTQGILSLGCYTNGTYGFNGFIDGVRITKGVGRYPSSCPVPTAEFRL